MITSTSGPQIQMRIEQQGGRGRVAPIPALAQGSTHPRYVQAKCRLQEKGGRLEDWGGQLGSHLPLSPSKLEEGQPKEAGFVPRSGRACRRALSARDGAAASCLTPQSQTILLRWTEERRTRGRRLWPEEWERRRSAGIAVWCGSLGWVSLAGISADPRPGLARVFYDYKTLVGFSQIEFCSAASLK
jgi:hypothetical protein